MQKRSLSPLERLTFSWKFHHESRVFLIIQTEIKKIREKKIRSKNPISVAKSSKKHNLRKWTPLSSISIRSRDMSNSLNSPYLDVVKITLWNPCFKKTSKKGNFCFFVFSNFTMIVVCFRGIWKQKLLVQKSDFSCKNFKKT